MRFADCRHGIRARSKRGLELGLQACLKDAAGQLGFKFIIPDLGLLPRPGEGIVVGSGAAAASLGSPIDAAAHLLANGC